MGLLKRWSTARFFYRKKAGEAQRNQAVPTASRQTDNRTGHARQTARQVMRNNLCQMVVLRSCIRAICAFVSRMSRIALVRRRSRSFRLLRM